MKPTESTPDEAPDLEEVEVPETPETREAEAGTKSETEAETRTETEAETETDTSTGPEERIDALESERDEMRERMLRSAAELDNFRKRTRREMEQAKSQGVADFALGMIDVLDNLERALESMTEDDRGSSIVQGIEMVHAQFLDSLSAFRIDRIDPAGKAFDPHFHEALLEEERDDVPPGTVLEELVRGYKIQDRLLRASRVRVSKAVESEVKNDDAEPARIEPPAETQVDDSAGSDPGEDDGDFSSPDAGDDLQNEEETTS